MESSHTLPSLFVFVVRRRVLGARVSWALGFLLRFGPQQSSVVHLVNDDGAQSFAVCVYQTCIAIETRAHLLRSKQQKTLPAEEQTANISAVWRKQRNSVCVCVCVCGRLLRPSLFVVSGWPLCSWSVLAWRCGLGVCLVWASQSREISRRRD